MPIQMIVTPGSLPEGFCPSSEQVRLNAYAQFMQVYFPLGLSTFNIGSTKPDPDQNTFPWYRLNNDGSPDDWYYYFNGYWLRKNQTPASSSVAQFWTGTLSAMATYDGGEGDYTVNTDGTITPTIAISSITGPMWEVNTYMQGRFPLGVSNTATIIKDAYGNTINQWAQGSQGGEIQHTLTRVENAPHTHTAYISTGDVSGEGTYFNGPVVVGNTSVSGGDTINGVANTPVGHQNMPPYYVGYWMQRTSRVFYRV